MNKLEQAARQIIVDWDSGIHLYEAITALREALAGDNMSPTEQAEQEPVGRWNWNEAKFEWLTKFDYYKHHMTPLYAASVCTKDLTDWEIEQCNYTYLNGSKCCYIYPSEFDAIGFAFARAIIKKFKEKNKC